MLDKQRKKQLQQQYMQMKPDMGIFVIRNKQTGKSHLVTSQNLKGKMNSIRFQLNFGNYPAKELQQDWTTLGENQFEVEILEKLKYDKDESKTDYGEELDILRMMWVERLAKDGTELYDSVVMRRD